VDKPDTRATVRQRSLQPVRPDQLERRLQERLDALGPPPRAELLHVLMLPDFEWADRIGEFWGYPESRAFAELLIDCGDRALRACLSACCGRPAARGVRMSRSSAVVNQGGEAAAGHSVRIQGGTWTGPGRLC
jgi:hypothetical protein